jgi:hypothetical protein
MTKFTKEDAEAVVREVREAFPVDLTLDADARELEHAARHALNYLDTDGTRARTTSQKERVIALLKGALAKRVAARVSARANEGVR